MDIYDNLEDYEDVNKCEKLEIENKELKTKLDDYQSKFNELQKDILQDFNELSSNHKNLLKNFSSLLKTAKVEIERKTAAIAQLNNEKDQLFLQLMSNPRNKGRPQLRKSVNDSAPSKSLQDVFKDVKFKKKPEAPLEDRTKNNLKEANKPDMIITKQERDPIHIKSDPRTRLAPDSPTVSSTKSTILPETTTSRNEKCERDFKENIALREICSNGAKGLTASSIRSRRRSMPAKCFEPPQFSSDEEYNLVSKTRPSRDDYDSDLARYPNDKDQWHRQTEAQERHLDREAPRDRNWDRSSRHNQNDLLSRNRDKYSDNYGGRNRRKSPEKTNRGTGKQRDFNETRNEYPRHRIESPPHDKYSRSKSRDSRSNYYDRYRSDTDHERFKQVPQERTKFNQKLHENEEEPPNKRRRTDSIFQDNKPIEQCHIYEKRMYDMAEYIRDTCQSPDDIVVENVTFYPPVREILTSPIMELDDPRKSSRKYVQIVENTKKSLTAASSRDVNLNLPQWANYTQKKVEETQRKDIHEDVKVDDNCMDVEDISTEITETEEMDLYSGLISEDNDDNPKNLENQAEKVINEKLNLEKAHDSHKDKRKNQVISNKRTNDYTKHKNSSNSEVSKKTFNPLESLLKNLEDSPSKVDDLKENSKPIKEKVKRTKVSKEQLLTNKALVAGDLELSDETCDATEAVKVNLNKDGCTKTDQDKSKENSKDISARFTDLFGETSLITPEDLNLNVPKTKEDTSSELPTSLQLEACLEGKSEVNTFTNCIKLNVEDNKNSRSIKPRKISEASAKQKGSNEKNHDDDNKETLCQKVPKESYKKEGTTPQVKKVASEEKNNVTPVETTSSIKSRIRDSKKTISKEFLDENHRKIEKPPQDKNISSEVNKKPSQDKNISTEVNTVPLESKVKSIIKPKGKDNKKAPNKQVQQESNKKENIKSDDKNVTSSELVNITPAESVDKGNSKSRLKNNKKTISKEGPLETNKKIDLPQDKNVTSVVNIVTENADEDKIAINSKSKDNKKAISKQVPNESKKVDIPKVKSEELINVVEVKSVDEGVRKLRTRDNKKTISKENQLDTNKKLEEQARVKNINSEEPVNIIPVPSVDDGVVKNIIISSGKQPIIEEINVVPEKKMYDIEPKLFQISSMENLALATSTPLRKVSTLNTTPTIEISSTDVNSLSKEDSRPSNANLLSPYNAEDAPDVRIILRKRKRRIIK